MAGAVVAAAGEDGGDGATGGEGDGAAGEGHPVGFAAGGEAGVEGGGGVEGDVEDVGEGGRGRHCEDWFVGIGVWLVLAAVGGVSTGI